MNNLINGANFFKNCLIDGVKDLTPTAVDTAVKVGFQDDRIAKIVYGIGLTILGLNLLALSNKATKNLASNKRLQNNYESQSSNTFIRWTTLALGVTAISYGVYSVVAGITDLAKTYDIPLHQPFSNDRQKKFAAWKDCDKQIAKAQKKLLTCPNAQELWNQVEAEGKFTIKCVKEEEAPGGAMVWVDRREIWLANNNREMLNSILFELNNLKQSKLALMNAKRMCYLNVDQYVRSTEVLEYTSSSETSRITSECVENGFWPETLLNQIEQQKALQPNINWDSLESYLKSQENSGHSDLYREMWYRVCDPKNYATWKKRFELKMQALQKDEL